MLRGPLGVGRNHFGDHWFRLTSPIGAGSTWPPLEQLERFVSSSVQRVHSPHRVRSVQHSSLFAVLFSIRGCPCLMPWCLVMFNCCLIVRASLRSSAFLVAQYSLLMDIRHCHSRKNHSHTPVTLKRCSTERFHSKKCTRVAELFCWYGDNWRLYEAYFNKADLSFQFLSIIIPCHSRVIKVPRVADNFL